MSLSNLILPFTNLLDSKDRECLELFTNTLNFQTNPSFVFNRVSQENVIDPEVRRSKTCFSKDPNLIGFVNDKVLTAMNVNAKGRYTFKLARDYVTFIKYDKGDFFDWHVDFEKLRVNHGDNGFKEMHFIYCIQGSLDGGQLLIKPYKNEDKIVAVEEARITNSAVVFDKLMEHKGAEVLEGTKIIMTVDVYVTTEARMKAGLSQKMEEELSDFLAKKREWVSLRGDTNTFKTVWSTLDHKLHIPFLELKATLRGDDYHVLGTAAGITYVKIHRTNCQEEEYEYQNNQWYFTNQDSVTNKFTLSYNPSQHKAQMAAKYNRSYDYRDREREKRDNDRFKLAEAFSKYQEDPAKFLITVLQELSMSEDDGGIDGWPNVKFMKIDKSIPSLEFLPPYFSSKEFQDWGWDKTEAGYSYHCNEPSYSEFDVNYRYGIMHKLAQIETNAADASNINPKDHSWETDDENASDESEELSDESNTGSENGSENGPEKESEKN